VVRGEDERMASRLVPCVKPVSRMHAQQNAGMQELQDVLQQYRQQGAEAVPPSP
jgi:hypothetical protein